MRSRKGMVQTDVESLLAQHAPERAPSAPDNSLRRTIARQRTVIAGLLQLLTVALDEGDVKQSAVAPTNHVKAKKRVYNQRYHAKKKLQKKGGKTK